MKKLIMTLMLVVIGLMASITNEAQAAHGWYRPWYRSHYSHHSHYYGCGHWGYYSQPVHTHYWGCGHSYAPVVFYEGGC